MATVVFSFNCDTSSEARTSVNTGSVPLNALINVVLPAPTGPVKMILCSNNVMLLIVGISGLFKTGLFLIAHQSSG